jgi:hypothetical protein
MKKLWFYVGTNYVGSTVKELVEVEDDATEEDIEKDFNEWMWNTINAGWYEAED